MTRRNPLASILLRFKSISHFIPEKYQRNLTTRIIVKDIAFQTGDCCNREILTWQLLQLINWIQLFLVPGILYYSIALFRCISYNTLTLYSVQHYDGTFDHYILSTLRNKCNCHIAVAKRVLGPKSQTAENYNFPVYTKTQLRDADDVLPTSGDGVVFVEKFARPRKIKATAIAPENAAVKWQSGKQSSTS